jgi:flagellar hook-length control protein FliK
MAPGSSAVNRAFGGQQAHHQQATDEPKGLAGLFGALLGEDEAGEEGKIPPGFSPDRPGTQTGNGLAGLVRLALAGGGEATDNAEGEETDPLAAVIDGAAQPAMPTDPAPMVNFIDALTALKTSLDQGEALDPELLKQVEAALADLADALGLDLSSLKVPEDFAALLETTGADDTGLAGAMTQLLAPLAKSMAGAEGTAAGADEAAGAQLKALGDKLAAMLAALEEGEVSADKLAQLGLTPGEAPADEIKAALERFAASLAAKADAVPEEPELAVPMLKTAEPALAGKTTETTETAEMALASGKPAEATDPRASDNRTGDDRGRDRPEPPTRTAHPAAPAATDASGAPSPSANPGTEQAQALRLDAAANPRIVQAGYQTSQQQLNLPQIAFELARQVQDGNTRFQIRLDPPELGRIDVRLDIDKSGQVTARLMVEKSETLDLMQRDQRGLERALQQAGLDSAKTNLEFSLKQNPFAGQQGLMGEGKGGQGQGHGNGEAGGSADTAEEAPPMVNLYRGALQASGVNIVA